MSSNFSIYVEEEAPVDDIAEGPNPAEDAVVINDGNRQPVTGLNDGEEVGQENVGNVPASDRSRSDQKKQIIRASASEEELWLRSHQ